MDWNEKRIIRIAILDMNEGKENQGMRCIREIINQWGEANRLEIVLQEFEVRVKHQTPGTDFDIYISSGGPGSPLESEGSEWENLYFEWIRNIENWNNNPYNYTKKHSFFICHSYQLITRFFNIANVCKRNKNSFGVFPMHLMDDASEEFVFDGLKNPFYAVDSRDFQVIEPDYKKMEEMGAKILALEKERPHVPLERAIMAIRFNDYFIGTQFHPEADAIGMSMYLQREDKKKGIIENFGEHKWSSMLEQLNDPDKILFTYQHILPNFLNHAVDNLVAA
ncbi:GMP synthase [Segetibacter sp.]|uniref:type 1 glutamine amidotransferase n=1 Tax=Segetibacter sp. TaxID=2231182 RepID=UPI0026375E27|nr:GMP synthase [Segetibacter sp.]MCW3080329.1 synthase [Segetibacter sp.]